MPMTDVDRGNALRHAHGDASCCRLLRGGPRRLDKPRHPLVAALQAVAIHLLELSGWEGVRRGTVEQRFHPCLQPRVLLDETELLDTVEEVIALQKRRIGRIDERIFGAVEEGATSLLFERL